MSIKKHRKNEKYFIFPQYDRMRRLGIGIAKKGSIIILYLKFYRQS